MNPIQKAIYALNRIPNQKNVGPNGESSYEIVFELERYVKDNPVPSLDKKLDKLWKDKYQYEDYERKPKEILRQFANDLQNGVETNKVQPNCKHIKRKGESCTLNNNCKYPKCDEKPARSTIVMRSNCPNWDDLRHCFKVYKGGTCTCN